MIQGCFLLHYFLLFVLFIERHNKTEVNMIPVTISTIQSDYERDFMIDLYNKFYKISESKAYAILHCHEDSEEVVQDAFVKLIDNLPKIIKLDPEKLAAYVIITVKNTAIDHFRKRNVEISRKFSFEEDNVVESLVDTKPLPEDIYLKQEAIEELSVVLNLLPEKYKIILEAKYVLGQSDNEISKILGISEKSVRMYLTRARRQAYDLLKGGIVHGAE